MQMMQVANFICKFGSKNLLDYLNDVVIPSFTDITLRREHGEAKYFFHKVQLINLDANVSRPDAVIGYFVKDTKLRRTQRYVPDHGLIRDTAQLQSSPSAFFMLILNNHKLLYIDETSYTPDLSSMRATINLFLGKKYE